MLSHAAITPYIPVADLNRARKFYENILGFKSMEETGGGIWYACGKGTGFFMYASPGAGSSKASSAFWTVDDVEAEVTDLRAKGVRFEEYDMPGLKTENGIATGGGAKAAWFKDTEGNILALIQRI